ncbi:hypothetical protein LdCL_110009650 [Leishmania donovani]|uniref:Uncharacterized protein n=1 Tax=Leishmania donovani TaxID=5661 RepID=A0A3S5H6I5_LEIDO|nr:hypothetical protein LdCL_110009650 [Leishmania donovani]
MPVWCHQMCGGNWLCGQWRSRCRTERRMPRSRCPSRPSPASTLNYASLFVAYVRLVKALVFLEVEESATGSNTARSTAMQMHAVLAGLVEMSTHVYLEKDASPAAASGAAKARVPLLSTVVKDLLSVREESRSSPTQYVRYVQRMLIGRTPIVPCIITQLLRDCQSQTALLTTSHDPTVLGTNVEILQNVFLWSVHAAIDEELLDVSHRAEVFPALPWGLYDAADAFVGQLTVRLAEVLLTCPAVCAHKDAVVLEARVIACEGLTLLLRFLLFVVIPCGVPDEVSWNARYRACPYATEERVMWTVAAFDCGSPHVLSAFIDALDQMSMLLAPHEGEGEHAAAVVHTTLTSPCRMSRRGGQTHESDSYFLDMLHVTACVAVRLSGKPARADHCLPLPFPVLPPVHVREGGGGGGGQYVAAAFLPIPPLRQTQNEFPTLTRRPVLMDATRVRIGVRTQS